MSRILVVALVCSLSLPGVSFGFETNPPANYSSGQANYGSGQAGWPVPKPSGLRFPDATAPTSVKTGGVVEGAAPCGACGQGQFGQSGMCIPWTVLPWYGSWDNGHHGGAGWRHCGGAGF
jgi:hypothetical protein